LARSTQEQEVFMLSIGLATLVFLIGIGIIVALTVRAGTGRTDGTIARVLYETEQSKSR
jgi:hypothetical protein